MRSTLALMLALLWVLGSASSQAADTDLAAWLDELLVPWQDPAGPGIVVSAARDDQILFTRAHGAAHVEHRVPITADTRFNAGSIAKSFTAYGILKLEAAGRLELDDRLDAHLDDLPSTLAHVTLRQLLQHTAGLKDDWTLASLAGWENSDIRTHYQARRMILRQTGLNFDPGARFGYSNSGYILLADVIAAVSGTSYAEWLETEVLVPLGLVDTLLPRSPLEMVQGLATPYEMRRAGAGAGSRRHLNLERSAVQSDVHGAGNLVTTAADLLRWGQHLLGTGNAMLQRMGEQAQLPGGTPSGYGLGLQVGQLGDATLLHHGGALSGYRSQLLLIPDEQLVVVVLGNVNTLRPGAVATEVADRLLSGRRPPGPEDNGPATTADASLRHADLEEAAKYRGRYLMENGRMLTVEAAEGRLFMVMGGSLQELRPVDNNRFMLAGEGIPVAFERSSNGRMQQMTLELPEHVMRAERLEPATVSGWDYRQYEGRYFSPALEVHYELVRDGEQLLARRSRGVDLEFTPIGDDRFLEWDPGDLVLKFERNRRGRVTGFTLSTSRARNVEFVRE